MKFPNGEALNLFIEVFNYKWLCELEICCRGKGKIIGEGGIFYVGKQKEVCVYRFLCMCVCVHLCMHTCLAGSLKWNKTALWAGQGRSMYTRLDSI